MIKIDVFFLDCELINILACCLGVMQTPNKVPTSYQSRWRRVRHDGMIRELIPSSLVPLLRSQGHFVCMHLESIYFLTIQYRNPTHHHNMNKSVIIRDVYTTRVRQRIPYLSFFNALSHCNINNKILQIHISNVWKNTIEPITFLRTLVEFCVLHSKYVLSFSASVDSSNLVRVRSSFRNGCVCKKPVISCWPATSTSLAPRSRWVMRAPHSSAASTGECSELPRPKTSALWNWSLCRDRQSPCSSAGHLRCNVGGTQKGACGCFC